MTENNYEFAISVLKKRCKQLEEKSYEDYKKISSLKEDNLRIIQLFDSMAMQLGNVQNVINQINKIREKIN